MLLTNYKIVSFHFKVARCELINQAQSPHIWAMTRNKHWLLFLTFFCYLTPDCHLQQLENPRDHVSHNQNFHQHSTQGEKTYHNMLSESSTKLHNLSTRLWQNERACFRDSKYILHEILHCTTVYEHSWRQTFN